MKAWRLKEPGQIELEDMESQPVGDNCVKVKILYSSVAVTDRLLASGKIVAPCPLILGRQAAGMVVETGAEVKGLVRGDMVAIKPVSACHNCLKCSEGKYSECENMLTFGLTEDGFLRDFAVLCSVDVNKLPERVSPRDATFIDLIDIAIETISRLNMDKGQYLVIFGATQLGIILAQVAIYYQIIPIITDINPSYLDIATQLGIYYSINSSEVDTKKRIFALTGGKMADAAAFIVSGDYPFEKIFDFVKRGGGIAICGLERAADNIPVSLAPVLNRRLNVMGITEGNVNISSAINMLANRTVKVESLVGDEIPFESAGEEILKPSDSVDIYLKTLVKI